MTDHRKDLVPREPGIVDRYADPVTGRVIEVRHIHDPVQAPVRRGDDLLRSFLPYFVIATMSLILIGGVVALLGLVVPMIMSMILAVVASFVSIVLSLVVTIIAGVVAAVGIGYLQTVNRRQNVVGDRLAMNREKSEDQRDRRRRR